MATIFKWLCSQLLYSHSILILLTPTYRPTFCWNKDVSALSTNTETLKWFWKPSNGSHIKLDFDILNFSLTDRLAHWISVCLTNSLVATVYKKKTNSLKFCVYKLSFICVKMYEMLNSSKVNAWVSSAKN